MRRRLGVAFGLFLVLGAGAAGVRAAEESAPVPEGLAVEPAEAEAVLRLAPECDRAVVVRLDGDEFAVGILHRRWRVAMITLRVPSAAGEYRLRAAFDRQGLLAEINTDPPSRLGPGFAEACLGLPAEAIRPESASDRAPLAALAQAAARFARLRATGRLDRAAALALDRSADAGRRP